MPPNVEREFKLRVPDEAARRALVELLEGPTSAPVRQLNHFFDTPAGELRSARLALRLRDEQGTFSVTLKGPRGKEDAPAGALTETPEEELLVDARTAEGLLQAELGMLTVLREGLAKSPLLERAFELVGDQALICVGAFENERLRVGPLFFPSGTSGPPLVFEFDRTLFPGGRVDRELEVELPSAAEPLELESALRALFSEAGLPFEFTTSKASRFFRILDSLSGGGPAQG